mmetsp:Transcript_39942/g.115108  ORF Transcript_39942/g.115108 Transcript_39942/m.115108 type:complete len:256 (+) Transcript_39942:149-916(+)
MAFPPDEWQILKLRGTSTQPRRMTTTSNGSTCTVMNGCPDAQAPPVGRQSTEGSPFQQLANCACKAVTSRCDDKRSRGADANNDVTTCNASSALHTITSPQASTRASAVSSCGVGKRSCGVTARNHSLGKEGSGPQWRGRDIICAAKWPMASELFAAHPLPPEHTPQPGPKQSMYAFIVGVWSVTQSSGRDPITWMLGKSSRNRAWALASNAGSNVPRRNHASTSAALLSGGANAVEGPILTNHAPSGYWIGGNK